VWMVSWIIKSSKLCNLRCRYCYEWNELAKRDRISLAQWEKLLLAVRWYHETQCATLGEPIRSNIVWHGGEPLLLPVSYFDEVLQLQRQIFGVDAMHRREYINGLQTNLYSLSDAHLDLIERENIHLGVSLDVVPGVRLTLGGQETEEAVGRNLRRLWDRGIYPRVIVVLGGHTRAHLRRIYDHCESLGMDFRVIPMFDAPPLTPTSPLTITDQQVVAALEDLFVHYMEKGCSIDADPLSRYLHIVLMRMTSLQRMSLDRRQVGEYVILMNTDGQLYEVVDRYEPGRSIGNIFQQSIEDILASDAYAASLARDDWLVERHCRPCKYRGACDSYPLFSLPLPDELAPGPCPVASRVCEFIEGYLREGGYTETELADLLPEATLLPDHDLALAPS
jgi:uncharacterized protein